MTPHVHPRTRIVIMVWHMKGCGHCEEYIPRFRAIAREYNRTFIARRIQIIELDAAAPALQPAADMFLVKATPTTIAAQLGGGTIRLDGAVSDARIRGLLDVVSTA